MDMYNPEQIAERIRTKRRLQSIRRKPSDEDSRVMNIKGEQWRTVEHFTFYEVSNLGRVRSWYCGRWRRRDEPRILLPAQDRIGYRHVSLVRNKRKHTKLIHVLVAAAFIGPKPEHKRVQHLDKNKTNNRVENLEYK